MHLMSSSLCVQFMGDIVKPASKDAGGQIQGTVTDLKEKASMLVSLELPIILPKSA